MNLKYELSLSSAKRSEADVIPRSLLRGEFIITGLLKKPDKGNVPSSGFLRYG